MNELTEGMNALAKRREMSNSTTLTKEQIKNLLLNAYGFIDKDGVLFRTDNYLIDLWEFELMSDAADYLEFSYDNCTFADGKVTFETHDADTEQFTVLAIAIDIMELIK